MCDFPHAGAGRACRAEGSGRACRLQIAGIERPGCRGDSGRGDRIQVAAIVDRCGARTSAITSTCPKARGSPTCGGSIVRPSLSIQLQRDEEE
jgi:hypothetical protein